MILSFLLIVYFVYIGLVVLQASWYKHKKLTERRFILLQVVYWSSFSLLGFMVASTELTSLLIGASLFTLWWIVGYPVTRFIYRRFFRKTQDLI